MIRTKTIFFVLIYLKAYFVISFIVDKEQTNNWAVLVAGSKGYWNYRHQADIAHAYQILIDRGFNKDRIVTMMYNDIVFDDENPHQGKLFNKPNGEDVYKGIKIDYIEKKVTVDNFLGILNGTGKLGKVLKIKPSEKVFIFLADHGSTDIFAFPNDEMLIANDLIKEIKKLAKRSKGVTIFVESCESGSLFLERITNKDKNILVFTASNAIESSYACYWSEEMVAYLGDRFSVSWMESVETMDTKKTTFLELYNIVKKLTNESHALNFGDKTMLNLNLYDFFGATARNKYPKEQIVEISSNDVIRSYDSQQYTIMKRCQNNSTKICLDKLKNLKDSIIKLNKIFNKLKIEMEAFKIKNNVLKYSSPYPDHVYSCYKNSVLLFTRSCISYNDVEKTFSYLGNFLKMCANGMDEKKISDLINANC